jgi:broad specificity phosphatase PhoE
MADFLVVIRSGATDYDRQGRIRGTLDIPLCAEGIADAERAAAEIAVETGKRPPIAAIYTSSATCAVETASIVGRTLGLQPRIAAELENLDQGLWQGMLVEDLRRKQPRLYRHWQDNPWSVSPPEGELLEEACGRVEDALVKLLKRHADGRIALVVPPPLDQIIRWLVAGESIGDLWSLDASQSAVAEIPLAAQWTATPALEKLRL